MKTDRPHTRTEKPLARRRLWPKLAVPVLFIAALPFAFDLAAKAYFSPDRISPLVDHALERFLPRRVSWQEMSFSPFSGLSFRDFRVGEHPDFGEGAFFSCRSLNLGLSLNQLVQGKIRINKISLSDPLLNLRQDPQGRLNLEDIAGEIKKAASSKGTEAAPSPEMIAFDLREILVRNGLALVDLQSLGFSQRARDLSFNAGPGDSGHSFEWTLDLTLGNIPARAQGLFDLFRGTGTVRLTAPNFPTRSLLRFFPRSTTFDLPQGQISLEANLALAESGTVAIKGSAAAVRTSLVLYRPNRVLKDLEAGLEFDLRYDPDNNRLDLETASLAVDQNQARLNGWIEPDGFELLANLRLADSSMLNRCGLLAKPLLSGGLELDLHLAPDKKDKATLADGRFITQGLALDAGSVLMGPLDLNAAFKASYGHQNNNLRLDSATVAWPGLDAAVSGNVSPKTMKLDLTGVKLDLARLKELFPSLIHPVRQGLIKADLSLSGDPARPRKWKLGGKAELSEAVLELGFLSDTLILGGPFEFKGRKVSFPLLNGKLGATTLAVDGEADLFTDPGRAEVDLDLDKFDLAGIAALAKDGRTGRQAESPFPPHWCSRLFWQGRVKVGTLSHLGRSLEKVRIKYHLDQGRLLLAPFKADIKPRGDLALNLTLDLDQYQDRTGYQGQMIVTDAQLETLTGFLGLDQDRLPKGNLNLVAAFGGKGLDLPSVRSNLTAQLTGEIIDGGFPDNPVFKSLSRFLGLDFLAGCRFSNWQGGLELTSGLSLIRGTIQSDDYSFVYQGRMDLDGRVDLKARMGLDPEAASAAGTNHVLAQAPRDGQGLYVMPLIIQGQGPFTGVAIDGPRLNLIQDELRYGSQEGP